MKLTSRPSTVIAGIAAMVMLASPLLAAADTGWQIPPPGYGYRAATPCPLSATARPLLYAVCEDQMALLQQALAEARAQNKLLLVEFGATWCGWCAALRRELPNEQVLGYADGGFDYAKAFHLAHIGVSTLAGGKLSPVPSGEAALQLVLDRAPGAEMRGYPFLAILDPGDSTRVYARNTADLIVSEAENSGHDPAKLRQVLKAGHDLLRLGKLAPEEPRRGWLSRLYHWIRD